LAQAATVLSGEELQRKMQTSIGDTVALEPGMRSASFGQAAGRPVIHGLGGARVRVMEDRIDTLDVSVTSTDHATTVEPFVADRIEILKGSSTLLYGPGAIGGVVDVHTGRIPHVLPEDGFTGRLELRGADNANKKVGALRLDGGAGRFAWHVDGFGREADAYEIPGFAESARLRALEEAESEGEAVEEARGKLPGSEFEAAGGAVGLSFIGERGFAGLAVSTLDADYGLPGGHGHEEGEDAEQNTETEVSGNPTLDMEQTRLDLEAGLEQPLAGFESLNFRVGINDYRHSEIEPDGAVATRFDNDAWEARLEIVHEEWAGWRGALGLQYGDREFSALGEEAFVPAVDTASMGLFWVGERSFNLLELETGVRVDRVEHSPADLPERDFTTVSGSLGLLLPLTEQWSLGLQTDYSQRAPVGEELYANGAHLATQSFELGNAGLDEESALNLSVSLRFVNERWRFESTLYRVQFEDFIYQLDTGDLEDGLPLLRYTQDDANFTGLDAEADVVVSRWSNGDLSIRATFDTVRAQLDDATAASSGTKDLPRIPARRYGAGVEAHWSLGQVWEQLTVSVDYRQTAKQNDVASLELPTDSFEDLSLYVGADLRIGSTGSETIATLFLQGRNLTDDEQRQHTSFIKDFAPAPGRSIEAGFRLSF
jgi:iron complex outermembrane receptor protein